MNTDARIIKSALSPVSIEEINHEIGRSMDWSVSELVRMEWGGYDPARQRLRWYRPKVKDWHELAMHPDAIAALNSLWRNQDKLRPDGWLFASQKGGRLTECGVRDLFKALGKDAGIPREKCHPHAIRASRLTHLIEAGAPLAVVQHVAAHVNQKVTSGYIRLATGFVDRVSLDCGL